MPINRWFDRLLDPTRFVVRAVEGQVVPAWQRVTSGESRVPVSVAILVAIFLELTLAKRVANHPRWLLPGISALLLIGLVVKNPTRINRQSRALRATTLLLVAVMSIANIASGTRLLIDLVRARGFATPATCSSPAVPSGSPT